MKKESVKEEKKEEEQNDNAQVEAESSSVNEKDENNENTSSTNDNDDVVANLQAELEKKDSEIATLKDSMLRRQADFENYKKIALKREEQNKKLLISGVVKHILQINDNLIRAVESVENVADETSTEDLKKSFIEGVNIISKEVNSTLENYSVCEIEAQGAPFDPSLHEAVEIDTAEGLECDTVTKVYQKGYKIDDFIIRPARVRVSKMVVDAK